MSIYAWYIACDGPHCVEGIYTRDKTQAETWECAREKGWRRVERDGEWSHYCPRDQWTVKSWVNSWRQGAEDA